MANIFANIYVCDLSFKYNGKDDDETIYRKLLKFEDLFNVINSYKEDNELLLNSENFINTVIFKDGTTVENMLDETDNTLRNKHKRDIHSLFISIISKCKSAKGYSYADMLELLKEVYNSETEVNALAAMNKIEDIPENNQILYHPTSFFHFRQYLISKATLEPKAFLDEIRKYFRTLIFPIDDKEILQGISECLPSHKKKLIQGLSVLESNFLPEANIIQSKNKTDFLHGFAIKYGIDDASFEGGHKKNGLYCKFMIDDNELRIYCGPHLKFYNKDNGEPGHARIYFNWDPNFEHVFIGLICQHI